MRVFRILTKQMRVLKSIGLSDDSIIPEAVQLPRVGVAVPDVGALVSVI